MAQRMARARAANRGAPSAVGRGVIQAPLRTLHQRGLHTRRRLSGAAAHGQASSSEDEDPWADSSSSEGGAPKVHAPAAALRLALHLALHHRSLTS